MNSSFFRFFSQSSIFLFIFLLIISILFIPVYLLSPESSRYSNNVNTYPSFDMSLEYIWPIPGYTKITSPFGKRTSPTAGASTFHKGIDIGAPEGTYLYAITNGTITFADFLGGGGYTITLSNENMKITYCHISPHFLVTVGEVITKGQLIAHVGPMYVNTIPNNPYKDKNGRPTNGAITGCHLHLGIRIQEEYINPLSLYQKEKEF